ncbi:MAG: hypothetical protein RLY31_2515 [Bacteroidota bacterium]|jgi:hypothetical protein
MSFIKKVHQMKPIFQLLSTLLLLVSWVGCAPSQDGYGSLRGTGPTVRQDLALDDFSGIELSVGNTEVMLMQGDAPSVRIEAQQNIIDNINRQVKNGLWDIKFRRSTRGFAPIRVWVTLPVLEEARLSGSGNIRSEGTFKISNPLRLSVTGSGDMDLTVEANRLEAGISGSGSIRLAGSARDAELQITGSGDMHMRSMALKGCLVEIVGSGDAAVWAEESLAASITGSGVVTYRGSPVIRSNVTGSGAVEPDRGGQ